MSMTINETATMAQQEVEYFASAMLARYELAEIPTRFRKLAAACIAVTMIDSMGDDRSVQTAGYEQLDQLQSAAVDDPAMQSFYRHVITHVSRFGGKELLSSLLAEQQIATAFVGATTANTAERQSAETNSLGSLIDKSRQVASKAITALATEPAEVTYEKPAPYNGGYPEVTTVEVELDHNAAQAEADLATIPGFSANRLSRLLGLRTPSAEDNAAVLEKHKQNWTWCVVRLLNGEDVGSGPLAQRVRNAGLTVEAARQLIPDIDERLERRQKIVASIKAHRRAKQQQEAQ